MPTLSSQRLETGIAAAWVPVACAVHCAATPLVLAAFPALGLSHSIEFELLGWGVSVVIGAVIAFSAQRATGNRRVVVPLALGAVLWLTSILGAWAPIPEALTSAGGSLLMAAAMIWYGRSRHHRSCEPDCGCPVAHGTPPSSASG